MKYFISHFILIYAVSLSAQDCKALLSINTDNELAFVIINNEAPVNGKNSSIELNPGTYIVTVGESSDRWDAKTFIDTVVITGCEKISRTYNFFRESMLKTEPPDVYVYSADTLVGHTPLLLPPDIKIISLKKPGYQDLIINVTDKNLNDKIDLKPLTTNNDENFFESTLFYYLSGSLLALGAATAYYKLKADDKYSEYQVTGNEALLEETQRLDTISGVTFGLLQINFALLLYFFLTD